MSTAEGDLVYVIRASLIDDTKMMRQVSVAQLTEFLLYVKEIHALVADARSARTGRLCTVVFANDISGISQIPDRKFSQALTQVPEEQVWHEGQSSPSRHSTHTPKSQTP